MINMRIKIALNLLFLKYASCFLNDEQYESSNAESNVKGIAKLPCSKIYFTENRNNGRTPNLIMWFKYGIASPVYSVDFRRVKEGSHWSAEMVFGSRAYFNIEEAVLSIEKVREEDAGYYKCRLDFDRLPTKNYLVNLSVIVPPEEVTISNSKGVILQSTNLYPIMEGQSLELICTASGGKPAPKVLWWHDRAPIDNQSDIILNNQVKNILHLDRLERRHHGSILKCEAVNGKGRNSVSKVVVVNLYLRPLGIRLTGNNEVFRVGKEYEIICETYGSRPPANITWLLKGSKIHSSAIENTISSDKNVTTSVLKFHPKFHHHRSKLTCKITNNYVASSTLTETWNLDVHYPPEVRVELGRNLDKSSVREGTDVYFDCIVDANPVPRKIYWTHNGGILPVGFSGVIISNQTLVLQTISRQTAGNYRCVAANSEGETQSDPYFLDVKYKPICDANQQWVYGAMRHEKIEITCNVDSNPPIESFVWKFNNSLIQTKDIRSFNVSTMHSVAQYQPKNELDYGTLLCWAKNELGSQSVPCVYHVIPAGKPDVPHNCTISSNTTENTLIVSCESGFDGGLPQEFICEVLTNGSTQLKSNITSQKIPVFTISGLERDLDYTIIIYSSNGKGRSLNRVELQVNSSVETSQKHTRNIGFTSKLFMSLWTIGLSLILVILLCFLFILIVSVVNMRKKHNVRQKQKKDHTEGIVATPIHSDDDRNPDVIPQIEEIYTNCSRRPSASSHTYLKPFMTEVTTYNTLPNPSVRLVNCSSIPVQMSPTARCDSIVQWIEPRYLGRNNSHVVLNTIPTNDTSSFFHLCSQAPSTPHKESAV